MNRFQRRLNRKVYAVLALAGAGALVGRGGSLSPGADAPSTRPAAASAAEVATTFRSYRLMVPQPIRVRAEQSALCAPAAPAVTPDPSRSVPQTAIRVYMNAPAARAFAEQAEGYPIGAVVVKEKLSSKAPSTRPTAPATRPTVPASPGRPAGVADEPAHLTWEAGSVGGMIKRAPGFAPADGDWEYFWVEDPAVRGAIGGVNPRRAEDGPRVETRQVASCAGCHQGRPTRDHVFGQWAVPVRQ